MQEDYDLDDDETFLKRIEYEAELEKELDGKELGCKHCRSIMRCDYCY